ncbi:MAG: PadR family transcriptional regulator [Rubrobacter sp.]|nr:PadR family transcriptional regulator [Rubrobacter sp.]
MGYALLGLLAREALTGYDLTSRVRERLGFFWGAGHSQIYPELAKLEERGLVSHRPVEQAERPDKKVYSITASGMQALEAWAVSPVPERPTRDELVLKAYSSWVADQDEAAAMFREEERRHGERLARYEEIRGWMEREWEEELRDPGTPQFATYATLRRGLGYEREYAEWCRWVAERLEGSAEG